MGCNVTNNSDMDTGELSQLIDDLASAIQQKVGFQSMPAITLQSDEDNAEAILGKTAYYDPQNKVITVYVSNRHPKDILRSIAHEFIHHGQNLRGEFDEMGDIGEGYAQNDEHLRNMEKEAYLQGNMCFRDWEDGYKRQMMESIHRKNSFKRRTTTMKIHNWKNNELNRLLMEKFNLGEGEYNRNEEEEEEEETLEESSCSANRDGKEEEECPECGKKHGTHMHKEAKDHDDGDGKDEKCDYIDCGDEKEDSKNESFRRAVRNLMEEILKLK
tara:strand:- start:134 stop:949 length:816 start_codon:yes stop_codon:yes gene_type:complete